MEKTLGGDRLGSGNKQKIAMRNYERSTHDLSYIWRSTMASGTLVPFMSELALPGDTFDIDLDADVKTHPTIGPLFGSYKIQLDVFSIPIRLYHKDLHMNKLEVGLNMASIKLPQMQLEANSPVPPVNLDNFQINPSCIFSYLNVRGVGVWETGASDKEVIRHFNAIPWLGYWDIYKNYYANKQEGEGVVIHNDLNTTTAKITSIGITDAKHGGTITIEDVVTDQGLRRYTLGEKPFIMRVKFDVYDEDMDLDRIKIVMSQYVTDSPAFAQKVIPLTDLFSTFDWNGVDKVTCSGFLNPLNTPYYESTEFYYFILDTEIRTIGELEPKLKRFPLDAIDKMRNYLMENNVDDPKVLKGSLNAVPYTFALKKVVTVPANEWNHYSMQSNQEGLGIKTYQSDLFNNWMSTEWIDGANGINEITAVQIVDDQFLIDELNLAKKIYDMLNRIAVSGGSYEDWIDVTYTAKTTRRTTSPIYQGGLISELAFQEVVSNAQTTDQPLGTLAGRGVQTGKRKGGKIYINVDEPSYIMGIVSLTPRLDYSQGNKWDMNLKTMDDLHKPALDEIGFQDLITDQFAWWDTRIDQTIPTNPIAKYRSAGKQPAWINYMTNVNQVRGNFADQEQQMFMVLNRRYEAEWELMAEYDYTIKDLTTYVDPVKFNHIFAYTRRDAQNFWTQIKIDIKARRKMSAKMMPNL